MLFEYNKHGMSDYIFPDLCHAWFLKTTLGIITRPQP
jgi:hypothetical protein